jgi:hypothetical protein
MLQSARKPEAMLGLNWLNSCSQVSVERMGDMRTKQLAGIIVIIGVGLLAATLLADVIGIGDDPGFGMQQTMGTITGVVITGLGLVVAKKSAN